MLILGHDLKLAVISVNFVFCMTITFCVINWVVHNLFYFYKYKNMYTWAMLGNLAGVKLIISYLTAERDRGSQVWERLSGWPLPQLVLSFVLEQTSVEIVNCLQFHWFLPSVICPDLAGTGSVCRCYSPNQWAFTVRLSALTDPADGNQIFTRTAKKCIRLLKQKLEKCDGKLPRERVLSPPLSVSSELYLGHVTQVTLKPCPISSRPCWKPFLGITSINICAFWSALKCHTKHHTHGYIFSRMSTQTLI